MMTPPQSVFSASLEIPEADLPGLKRNLEGFIDLHLHLAPDRVLRTHDDIQFAGQAAKIGYGGFLLKDHFTVTAGRAYTVSKEFPGLHIGGGVVLNRAVGGINPDAVEAALLLGAKQVWMPTFDTAHHFLYFGMFSLPGTVPVKEIRRRHASSFKGITVLDPGGALKQEVQEVLEMVADSGVVLGTGHLSLEEIRSLVAAARKTGVKKMLVTHPEFLATMWPTDAQVELANQGAIMEHCANVNYDAALVARNIKAVGAERCVLSSDSGQVKKGHPSIFMSKFIDDLIAQGVTRREVEIMIAENPAKLLDLD